MMGDVLERIIGIVTGVSRRTCRAMIFPARLRTTGSASRPPSIDNPVPTGLSAPRFTSRLSRFWPSPGRRITNEDAMEDALSYIRVSSEEQADSGLGLEAQRQRIAAYCAMKGLRLAEVFADPGISGGKPLASRSAGSKLLAVAKKGKAVVVVAKLDRLFHSADEFSQHNANRVAKEVAQHVS